MPVRSTGLRAREAQGPRAGAAWTEALQTPPARLLLPEPHLRDPLGRSAACQPLCPQPPAKDTPAAVTLVTFCQPGAGLKPAHHKIASKQVYTKPNVEEQLLEKGETPSLHSQTQPGKAS